MAVATTKRRRLEDIDNEAIQTDDPERLDELYTEYMHEAKWRRRDSEPMQEVPTSSLDPATHMAVESNVKRPNVEVDQVVEKQWCVYAWADVNNAELPTEAGREGCQDGGDAVHEWKDVQGCQAG